VIPEDVHADDLALPQGEDAGELHVRLRALTRSAPDIANYHAVGGVDEVHHWLQRVALPSVAQLLDFAEDRLPAHRGAWLWPTFDVVHDHIGIEKVTERIEVLPVPGVVEPLHDLHVLLRHRPRSISPLGGRVR
jgi:hypothetical protein